MGSARLGEGYELCKTFEQYLFNLLCEDSLRYIQKIRSMCFLWIPLSAIGGNFSSSRSYSPPLFIERLQRASCQETLEKLDPLFSLALLYYKKSLYSCYVLVRK